MLLLSSFWVVVPLFFLSWCCFSPFSKLLVLSSFWVVGPLFFLSWCYSSPFTLCYQSSLLSKLVLMFSFLWAIAAPFLFLNYYCFLHLFELAMFFSSLWGVVVPFLILRCSFSQARCLFFLNYRWWSSLLFQLLLLVLSPLSMPFSPFFYLLKLFYLNC